MNNYKVVIYANFYGPIGHKNRMDTYLWDFYNFIQRSSKCNVELRDESENLKSICDENTILYVVAGILPDLTDVKCFKKIYDYADLTCRCGYKCLGNLHTCKSKNSIRHVKQYDHILYRYDTYIIREHLQKCNIEKFPYYFDNDVFKDWKLEKQYDILFFGNIWKNFYPFRNKLYNILKKNRNKFKCLFLGYNLTDHTTMVTKEELSKLINQSWLTVATKSTGNLLFMKYYEIAFSNSIVLGDYPDLEQNYFADNMININIDMTEQQIVSIIQNALSDKNKLIQMGNTTYDFFTKHFEYKNGLVHFDNVLQKAMITKKILVYLYDGFGDYFSYNGLLRYLTTLYDKVYVSDYFNSQFGKTLTKDNKNIIFLCSRNEVLKFKRQHLDIDILDARVHTKFEKQLSAGFIGNYFDVNNKIGQHFGIECNDNIEIIDNASGFYIKSGIPSDIRIKYFYYERDCEVETQFYNKILEKYNLSKNDKYTLICEYGTNLIDRKYIETENVINMHKLANSTLDLLYLIENANDIHLIENSIALMIYMLQIKKLLKQNKIYFHVTARNDVESRKCTKDNYQTNIFSTMLLNPKIDDWVIVI